MGCQTRGIVRKDPKASGMLSPPVMMMKRFVYSAVLALALIPAGLFAQDDTRGAKEDVKEAGRATKDAAKDAGRATKKTAKKGARATKRGAHAAARKTRQGAEKLEDKTNP
jgi:predicted small secreted protein